MHVFWHDMPCATVERKLTHAEMNQCYGAHVTHIPCHAGPGSAAAAAAAAAASSGKNAAAGVCPSSRNDT